MADQPIHYSLSELIAPAEEPVTTAEAKSWMNVDTSADDTMIGSMITAARQQVEIFTRRRFVASMLRMSLDRFPTGNNPIFLRSPPLLYLKQIQYIDTNGTTQVWGDVAMEIRVTPATVEVGDVFDIIAAGVTIATFTATDATVANVTAGLETTWNASTSDYATYVTATDQTTYLELLGDTGQGFAVTTSTTDGGGADTQTLVAVEQNDESTVYTVDATSILPRIEPARTTVTLTGQDYPDTNPDINAVLTDYVAGYGAASAVPEIAKTAIKFLVADMYEHRESQSEISLQDNQTVKDMLWSLRVPTAA